MVHKCNYKLECSQFISENTFVKQKRTLVFDRFCISQAFQIILLGKKSQYPTVQKYMALHCIAQAALIISCLLIFLLEKGSILPKGQRDCIDKRFYGTCWFYMLHVTWCTQIDCTNTPNVILECAAAESSSYNTHKRSYCILSNTGFIFH